MQEFSFRTQLVLPRKRDEIFQFFADARNLEVLTPPWLRFCVLTPPPIKMHPGTLIDYKLRVHGLPMKWRSEITAWEPPTCFVDEQRRGPYRTWIHEHRFDEIGEGTLCTDFVRYSVFGGAVINWLFVRCDLEKIFEFRTGQLQKLFRAAAKPNDDGHRTSSGDKLTCAASAQIGRAVRNGSSLQQKEGATGCKLI